MPAEDLIEAVRTGVVQIGIRRGGNIVANGTGFLVDGGIVPNSHVIRPGAPHDDIVFRCEGVDANDPRNVVVVPALEINQHLVAESYADARDAFLDIDHRSFDGR